MLFIRIYWGIHCFMYSHSAFSTSEWINRNGNEKNEYKVEILLARSCQYRQYVVTKMNFIPPFSLPFETWVRVIMKTTKEKQVLQKRGIILNTWTSFYNYHRSHFMKKNEHFITIPINLLPWTTWAITVVIMNMKITNCPEFCSFNPK